MENEDLYYEKKITKFTKKKKKNNNNNNRFYVYRYVCKMHNL